MSSASNSSNLLGNVNVSDISNSGARLIMTHDLSGFSGGISGTIGSDGVTAGDVIRYDAVVGSVSNGKYIKAQANIASNSEVVGVIESINDDDVVNVVLSGQIIFPSNRLADMGATPSGASGGADVYFLSSATGGGVQDIAPEEPGEIAKPVLQMAADGTFNAHVVNYIGYQVGGSVAAYEGRNQEGGEVASLVDFGFEGRNISINPESHKFALNKENWLPTDPESRHFEGRWTYSEACDDIIKGRFGEEYTIVVDATPPSNLVGQTLKQKRNDGATNSSWEVMELTRSNNSFVVRGVNVSASTNSAIPIDGTTIYHGNVAYTMTSITRTSFALPRQTASESVEFTDFTGKKSQFATYKSITFVPDGGSITVTIPPNIGVSSMEVDSLIVKSTDGLRTATNVGQILYDMSLDINNISESIGKGSKSYTVS
jgi:hypothetical protein